MGQQQPMSKEQISQTLKNNVANAKVDAKLTEFDENIEKARLDLQTAIYSKQRYIMQVSNARSEAAEQNLANWNAQLKAEADKAMEGTPGPAAPANPAPAPAAPTPEAVVPEAPAPEAPAADKKD